MKIHTGSQSIRNRLRPHQFTHAPINDTVSPLQVLMGFSVLTRIVRGICKAYDKGWEDGFRQTPTTIEFAIWTLSEYEAYRLGYIEGTHRGKEDGDLTSPPLSPCVLPPPFRFSGDLT